MYVYKCLKQEVIMLVKSAFPLLTVEYRFKLYYAYRYIILFTH